MADKITPIFPGMKTEIPIDQAVANMKNELPALLEYIDLMAQLRRRKYKALISQGFDEKQALFLCDSSPLE